MSQRSLLAVAMVAALGTSFILPNTAQAQAAIAVSPNDLTAISAVAGRGNLTAVVRALADRLARANPGVSRAEIMSSIAAAVVESYNSGGISSQNTNEILGTISADPASSQDLVAAIADAQVEIDQGNPVDNDAIASSASQG